MLLGIFKRHPRKTSRQRPDHCLAAWCTQALLWLGLSCTCPDVQARLLPDVLQKHAVPAWIIDPASGLILDANESAVAFYGYPELPHGKIHITAINQLSEHEIRAEIERAQQEKRSYYLFPHRLANGNIVTVEVHSSPFRADGQTLLLSLLLPESRNLTLQQQLQRYQTRLESLVEQRTEQAIAAQQARSQIMAAALAAAVFCVAVLLIVLHQLRRTLRREQILSHQLEHVLHGAQLGYGQWDLVHNRITLHPRLLRLLGENNPQATTIDSTTLLERLHPQDRHQLRAAFVDHLKGVSEAIDLRFRLRHTDGHWIWIQAWGRVTEREPVRGRAVTVTAVLRDISHQVALEQSRAIALSVFQDAGEAIVVTDEQGVVLDVNDAMVQLTGYAREELIHQTGLRWRAAEHQGTLPWSRLRRKLLQENRWRGEAWWQHRDGHLIPVIETISAVRDTRGHVIRHVVLAQDISILKAQQQALERQAFYDTLTGLPNRALLTDRLALAIATAHRHGRRVAVAYLDLDGFKEVNDRHGHLLGDAVLREMAQRLQRTLREGDTLARVGGDEFVAVLADLDESSRWQSVVDRLLQTCSTPLPGLDLDIPLTTSIGVTLYPDDGADAEVLLRHADQALYRAKRDGKNRWVLFNPLEDRQAAAHAELIADVRRGLSAGEFVLYLQPRVRLRDGTVLGAEALLRWQHPRDGLRLPGSFLPAIEQDDVMIELGEWVLHEALRLLAQWQAHGHTAWQLSINVAAAQLRDPSFEQRLQQALQKYPNTAPQCLELEIVESSALENIETLQRLLMNCRSLGLGIAIDDFGTGYSSLAYLKQLPATVVKIDQSFVRDIFDDPSDLRIIDGIVALGHAFNLQVVAEGVETTDHGTLLLRLGADVAQGYGIAHPMPADAWNAWLNTWHPPAAWQQWAPVVCAPWSRLLAQAEVLHQMLVDQWHDGLYLDSTPAQAAMQALQATIPNAVRSSAIYSAFQQAHATLISMITAASQKEASTAKPTFTDIKTAYEQWKQALHHLLPSLCLQSR